MNLIKLSIMRPVLVTMILVGLTGIGFFCYMQLPKELFPEIEMPIVTVVTYYEGAGPEEVEQLISKRLEDEISTVEGIKHINSISQQGISLIMIEFYLETDVDVAAADVRAKVDVVRQLLPEEAEDPITQKFDFNAQPVVQMAVTAPRTLRDVYFTADEKIKDRLATIPDVASVTLIGGQEREIHILANQQRMRSYGLSITNIIQTVAAANLEAPGGHIWQNSKEYNIRVRGKFTDLDEIRDLRVMTNKGKNVYLRDVAEVRDSYKDMRDMVRSDGQTAVGITVQKRADGNVVKVVESVQEMVKKLNDTLPDDYTITIQEEQATWVTSSIQNVYNNIIVGILLTAVALFLFLHSFRAMIIISMTMPISVLATYILMYGAGITMNMMSLMGLAMTVGVLVNNAILVLENITRYLHMGHSPNEASREGASEIAIAVASTTLTNVVVFVPIAFMGGIIGQFFKDFGLTATFATIVSLFLSFTLTPMMAAKLLTEKNTSSVDNGFLGAIAVGFDNQLNRLKEGYRGMLRACLHHRKTVLFVVLAIFVSSFFLAGYIGAEFITNMDQGKFVISVEMPTGTRLEETNEAITKLETVLRDKSFLPELVSTYASIGSVTGGGIGGASQAVNIGQINVTLNDKEERDQSTSEIINRIRPELAKTTIPGVRLKVMESGGGGEAEAAIQMQLTGEDLDELHTIAEELMVIMNNEKLVPGAVDVDSNFRLGQPEIRIIPDREKCREFGISTRELSQVVTASFEGLLVSEYREGAYNYDIRVRNDETSRKNLPDVEALTIMDQTGHLIPLPELAEIEVTTGPSQLFRKDRQSMISVSCDAENRSPGEVLNDILANSEKIFKQHPDVSVSYAGQIEMMNDSFARLGIALVMAISLTYILLACLLESYTQPLIIMFSLPLSLIGVFLALFLMNGTFSIFSIMSIIMLVGLVINNSIVVIDYINILRKKGMSREEAIVESGTTRLRPILMANLTTIAAMIPLALGWGWGGEMRAPMAMVQIGGLVAGGWMGLLIVPIVYTMSDDFNNFVKRFFGYYE